MPVITRALLRKRAEHNEGMIGTLEEVTLHQEELEGINEVLGMTCRKLKILYLQNNIIPKMENLFHLKDVVYLNLALNNIQKIEGVQNCEFLQKLDLTINFVDLDALKESMENLQSRENLRELYMMGNPSEHTWPNFQHYVIAKLPQLANLDGTEITRSMQLKARQQLPALEVELAGLAKKVAAEKARKEAEKRAEEALKPKPAPAPEPTAEVTVEDVEEEGEGDNDMTENTPEVRVKIYQELAQQKKDKEERENVNKPKKRDFDKEQKESIKQVREKEELEAGEVKQRNEGGWDFYWDEDIKPGSVVLEVRVPRHLDSSLIDVDIHPTYVSVVIKSKLLRLRLPAEIKVGESKCQRAKVNGALVITMPKVNPRENAITLRAEARAREKEGVSSVTGIQGGGRPGRPQPSSSANNRTRVFSSAPKKLSLQEQMQLEAQAAGAGVDVGGGGSLLDAQIGAKSAGVDVQNIVRRPEAAPEEAEVDSVFRTSSRVVELD